MSVKQNQKEKLDKLPYENTIIEFIRLFIFCSVLFTLLMFSHTKEFSTLLMFFGITFAFFAICIPIMLYYFPVILIGYFLFERVKNRFLRILYIAISIPLYVLFNLNIFGNCKSNICGFIATPAWLIGIYIFIFTLPVLLYTALLIPKRWFHLKWETFFTILITLIIINFIQPYLNVGEHVPLKDFLFAPFKIF